MMSRIHFTFQNVKVYRRAVEFWKICCWIHILAWINHSCIVINKLLVLDGSLHYVQCVPYAAILQIFLLFSQIWYCRVQSPAVFKQQDVRWCSFRRMIPLSLILLYAHFAYERDTAKILAAFSEFPIVRMIWYGCVQSSAMFKLQDVRWCGCRRSIPILIDYVWRVCNDRAISAPW